MGLDPGPKVGLDHLNSPRDLSASNTPRPQIKGTSFFCERCQRQSGPEMVQCEYRATDECPYSLRCGTGSSALSGMLGFFVFGCVFLVPLYALVTAYGSSTVLTLVLLTVLPVGFGALFFAVYSCAYHEVRLSNPANGFAWHELTLFGFPLRLSITVGVKPLALDWSMTDAVRPDLPTSIQCLKPDSIADTARAQRILETTLLGLLKCGALTACSPISYRAYLGGPLKRISPPNYVLMLNPDKASKVEGELERRIIASMMSWQSSGKIAKHGGMNIVDICRALHAPYTNEPYWRPDVWLLDIVKKDAVRWGIGSLKQRPYLSILFWYSYDLYCPNSATFHLGEQVDLAVMDFYWVNAKFGRFIRNQVTYGFWCVSPKNRNFWDYFRRKPPDDREW